MSYWQKESAKYLIGTLILEATTALSGGKSSEMSLSFRIFSFVVGAIIIFFGVKH